MNNLPVQQKIAIARYEHKDIPSYLTFDEVNLMLESCKNRRDHLLLNILWQTGCRIGEALSLRRTDIDLYGSCIRVITEKKGKKNKPPHRIISTGSNLLSELLAYILDYHIEDKLFPFTRQRAWQIIKQTAKQAGITKRVFPHVFRHSFAVHCLRSGMPLPVLQKVLGHSSILVTMIYLRIVQADTEEFLRRVQF